MVSLKGVLLFVFCLLGSSKSQSCHHDTTTSTQQANIYPWPALSSGVTQFTFKVRAQDNAHVGLATAADDSDVQVEVVLGTDGGTRTMINRCKQCLQVAIENTPDIISANEDREFYISWAGNNVQVGRVGEAPFISHQFTNKQLDGYVDYIGIHTGWGHPGDWTYCGGCPQGWGTFQGQCYRYFSTSVSWNTAETQCQSHGAELASVHSTAEDNFVDSLHGTHLTWIGLHKVSNQWQWSDETSFDFNDWGSWGSIHQPDNAGGHQDCVKIGWSKSSTQWDDRECNKSHHYVCKKSTV